MNYIARHMEEKYNIPWVEYNFFGPTKILKSLRKIAAQFDETIQANAEKVIAKYQPLMDAVIAKYKPRLQGKKVMLYVGGLRPRHVIGAYEDLGMEVVGTGYEFGHNDDYQRTTHYVKDGTLIYDDVTGYEFEKFVEKVGPISSAPASRRSMSSRRWACLSGRCTPGIIPAPITAMTASPSLPAIWTWR